VFGRPPIDRRVTWHATAAELPARLTFRRDRVRNCMTAGYQAARRYPGGLMFYRCTDLIITRPTSSQPAQRHTAESISDVDW